MASKGWGPVVLNVPHTDVDDALKSSLQEIERENIAGASSATIKTTHYQATKVEFSGISEGHAKALWTHHLAAKLMQKLPPGAEVHFEAAPEEAAEQ